MEYDNKEQRQNSRYCARASGYQLLDLLEPDAAVKQDEIGQLKREHDAHHCGVLRGQGGLTGI